MKRLFLILAFAFVSCTANEDESITQEECFRIVQVVYMPNDNYIVLDVYGDNIRFDVQNASNYQINQLICNLNEIQ